MSFNITQCIREDGPFGPALKVQINDGGEIKSATIYKKQKDGTEFPFFDTISAGSIIEGNLWMSPKGYLSIFPQKPKPQGGLAGGPQKAMAQKSANIDKAMDRKENGINKTLDRKEDAVKISATFRDATALTVAMLNKSDMPLTEEAIKRTWLYWRKWLLDQFDGNENPNHTSLGDPEPFPDGPEYTEADYQSY